MTESNTLRRTFQMTECVTILRGFAAFTFIICEIGLNVTLSYIFDDNIFCAFILSNKICFIFNELAYN